MTDSEERNDTEILHSVIRKRGSADLPTAFQLLQCYEIVRRRSVDLDEGEPTLADIFVTQASCMIMVCKTQRAVCHAERRRRISLCILFRNAANLTSLKCKEQKLRNQAEMDRKQGP